MLTSRRSDADHRAEDAGTPETPTTAGPVVTVGIPVYNGANFLAEALDCLLAQTYEDFEIVVSDNGSTDETPAILARYAETDPRIRVHRVEENRGAAWNFNRVLELARGRYFHWHAHDDVVLPTYLERCVAVLDEDPEVVVAYTGVDMVDEQLELIEHYGERLDVDNPDPVVRFAEQALQWNLCFDVFGLIRMSALATTEGMGGFSHGDGILLAHLALLGRSQLIDEPLFLSRTHHQQSMKRFGYEGGGNDYRQYALWFDPNRRGGLIFPNWTIVTHYNRVVGLTSSLSRRDALRARWVVMRRIRRDARLLVKDLVFAARSLPMVIRARVRGSSPGT